METKEETAIGIIREAIDWASRNASYRRMTLGDAFESAADEAPEVSFRRAVRNWALAARMELGHRESWVWSTYMKPWLKLLVGWFAMSELGQAAGSRGYWLLCEAWNNAGDVKVSQEEGRV
jgi:hypothetical protein